MHKNTANDAMFNELKSKIKNDLGRSEQLSQKTWTLIIGANLIGIAVAYIIGFQGSIESLMGLVIVSAVTTLGFWIFTELRPRLIFGFVAVLLYVFWQNILDPSTLEAASGSHLGHGDVVCFGRGIVASAVTLGGLASYFYIKKIGPTRSLTADIAIVSVTAGVVSQAWFCMGGSLSHTLFSHFGVALVTAASALVLFALVKKRWLS